MDSIYQIKNNFRFKVIRSSIRTGDTIDIVFVCRNQKEVEECFGQFPRSIITVESTKPRYRVKGIWGSALFVSQSQPETLLGEHADMIFIPQESSDAVYYQSCLY